MTDERLEKIISMSMPQISPSTELNRQIMDEMDVKKGKRLHMKKVVVLAVACMLMLSSITAVAGTIYYYTSVATGSYYTKDYRKIDSAEEIIGSEIKFIRNFVSGFSFEHMKILDHMTYARGEGGEVSFIEDYATIEICYSGDKGQVVLFCWKDAGENMDVNAGQMRNIAGIEVKYETAIIDNVASSMYITSIDEANEEEYTILIDATYCSASWTQDGVCYDLFAPSYSATEEEILSMAEELILSE